MTILSILIFITNLLLCFYQISSTTDIITYLKPLHDDGTTTLVSNYGTFELGFFTPGSSRNRYVGIWYKNIPERTIVWVANRDCPITDGNSSTLSINREGNLVLLSKNQTLVWSTNSSSNPRSIIVQLLDNGNLVLREENKNSSNYEGSFLWQSFDYPCDTLLPGMKLGWDKKTGLNRRLTAWKNWDDPSPGNFSWGIKITIIPELVMWKGFVEFHRSGPWNGVRFSGAPLQGTSTIAEQILVNEEDEVSYMYILKNKAMISIIVLNQTLSIRRRFIWVPENRAWELYQSVPRDICDTYNPCGSYGNCDVNFSPICHCLEGFDPKLPRNWNTIMDWKQGCVRREPWSCEIRNKNRVGFHRFRSMKLPDTSDFWFDQSMELEDCKEKCIGNCSCTAYANLDVRGDGSGCAIWFGDLLDLRVTEGGQDLYVRMATPSPDAKLKKMKKKIAVLVTTITIPIVLMLLLVFSYTYRTQRKFQENTEEIMLAENKEASGQEDFELPIFDLETIVKATNDFSIDNKLGQGGFGPVYKGILENGQEIAVKRLSKDSGQGLNEFKNEVILCAKLQHRNLVRVLGCCIQGEEKMLVYEYMPHRSLDSFLFDSAQSKILDWPKRFQIICAIARGLLYLHQDSRLRIIHRDLKASNILLDNNMNAKISDFGLARMCRGDQDEGSTHTVVGTYGYMAPEYAIDGLFSTKSDVFSFGVLLLEIISGKKNKGLSYPNYSHNLIGHAWRLWKEGNPEELIDDCLRDSSSCIVLEITRCIQIGLLCLQHHFDDRPDMAFVMVMLSIENTLPHPKEPGFLIHKVSFEGETKQITSSSTNQVTVSLLSPR